MGRLEKEEQALLNLIRQASNWDGYTFDPLSQVLAVNRLQAAGQGRALVALRAFWQEAQAKGDWLDDSTRLLLLARLLFVPPPGLNFPPPRTGMPVEIAGLP